MNEEDRRSDSVGVPEQWSLRCPACDYSLTGLTVSRCPECGQAFDAEVLRTQPRPTGWRALSLERRGAVLVALGWAVEFLAIFSGPHYVRPAVFDVLLLAAVLIFIAAIAHRPSWLMIVGALGGIALPIYAVLSVLAS